MAHQLAASRLASAPPRMLQPRDVRRNSPACCRHRSMAARTLRSNMALVGLDSTVGNDCVPDDPVEYLTHGDGAVAVLCATRPSGGNDPVAQDGQQQVAYVVGQYVFASLQRSEHLRCPDQLQCGARAGAEPELAVATGRLDEVDAVLLDGRSDVQTSYKVDHRHDLGDRDDRRDLFERVLGVASAQHRKLGCGVGVAHGNARHEPVALRLGKRIRPFHLERVLCGDDGERRAQHMSGAVHGDLAFFHGFEKRRLGFGRSTVDFVADDDVGEDGAWLELELARCLVVGGDAGDVRGKQVGGELNAPYGAVDRFGEGLGKHRLADAGDIFDQQMPLCEQHDKCHLGSLGLPVDHGIDVVQDPFRSGMEVFVRRRVLPIVVRATETDVGTAVVNHASPLYGDPNHSRQTESANPVSYTHLTLPTIYSV